FTIIPFPPRTPQGGILEATDGKLYGSTRFGGVSNFGTLFRIDLDGSNFAVIHEFAGAPQDGASPTGRLFEGKDGAIYGTTLEGGAFGAGAIFRVNKNGTDHTILHHFSTS